MPRSGTKLLRGLLNSHPNIKIPPDEPAFLPFWIENWSKFGDLSKYANFVKFYRTNEVFPYFVYMEKNGIHTDVLRWYQKCLIFDVIEVFKKLIELHVNAVDNDNMVIGAKAPEYIRHLHLIKNEFRNSKIIHIVRDVRDYCLSNKKAWNRNLNRSAHEWNRWVCRAKYDSFLMGKMITKFLNIEFSKDMLQLTETTESIGELAKTKNLIKGNYRKYQKELTPKQIKGIESIAKNGMLEYGYESLNNPEEVILSKLQISYYKITDQVNFLFRKFLQNGFRHTVKHEIGSIFVTQFNRIKKWI
jgi:hypothetical protein